MADQGPGTTPDPSVLALSFLGMSLAITSALFGGSTLGLTAIGVQAVLMLALLYVVIRRAARTVADAGAPRPRRVPALAVVGPVAAAAVFTCAMYGVFPDSDAAGTTAGVAAGLGVALSLGALVARLAMRKAHR